MVWQELVVKLVHNPIRFGFVRVSSIEEDQNPFMTNLTWNSTRKSPLILDIYRITSKLPFTRTRCPALSIPVRILVFSTREEIPHRIFRFDLRLNCYSKRRTQKNQDLITIFRNSERNRNLQRKSHGSKLQMLTSLMALSTRQLFPRILLWR